MKDRTKGNLALLLTAVLWGTGFISQKIGLDYLPPLSFNSIRELMAVLVLGPLALRALRRSRYLSADQDQQALSDGGFRPAATRAQIQRRRLRLLAAGVICGFCLFTGSATQQIGLMTVSAGKSGFISAVYIVLVPVFSIILGDRVSRRAVFCVVMAMFGFAVMSLSGGLERATPGDWLTLVSAAGFAAQIVAVNYFLDKDNAIMISALQMFFAGAFGLALALITEDPTLHAVWLAMPVLLYQTIVPTALGYTFQIVGQKYTDPSTAALIMSTEAVFAAIFGALILGEMMSVREIAGSAIIFAATIIGQRDSSSNSQ
ncbi:MAG: DMT family transporter [Mogibacterium sp.]|nr:DMT family transporter [Mogibacterium sp.]